MTDDDFVIALTGSITRGIVRGLGAELRNYMESGPNRPSQPIRERDVFPNGAGMSPQPASRVTAPDIDPSPESIDLMSAIKKAAREEDVDLSDIALVEHVLQEQRLARMTPEPPEGTRRVTAPDA
mgnify:CR=1 FL=1